MPVIDGYEIPDLIPAEGTVYNAPHQTNGQHQTFRYVQRRWIRWSGPSSGRFGARETLQPQLHDQSMNRMLRAPVPVDISTIYDPTYLGASGDINMPTITRTQTPDGVLTVRDPGMYTIPGQNNRVGVTIANPDHMHNLTNVTIDRGVYGSSMNRLAMEAAERWREVSEHIPFFELPPGFQICVLPPTGGAAMRFRIKNENGAVISVYLDTNNALGYYSGPYYEIYDEEETERFPADETGFSMMMERIFEIFKSPRPPKENKGTEVETKLDL